ncbi:hypothetical protein Q8F55_003465 [Vanrija albida]|uniref:Uncharacterized protein n=1 Tax=Vanrija albida TaxID=181172 RepID=A0ABR3Q4E2_9TREE
MPSDTAVKKEAGQNTSAPKKDASHAEDDDVKDIKPKIDGVQEIGVDFLPRGQGRF